MLKGEKANRPTRPSAQRVVDRPPQEIRKRRTTDAARTKKQQKSKFAFPPDFAASPSFSIPHLSRRVKKPRRLRSAPKRKKSSDAPKSSSKDFLTFVKIGKVDRLQRFSGQSSGLRSSLKSAVCVDLSTFCVNPDVAADRYFASIAGAVTGSVTEPSPITKLTPPNDDSGASLTEPC